MYIREESDARTFRQLKHKSQKPFRWSKDVILLILTHTQTCRIRYSIANSSILWDDFLFLNRKGVGQKTEGLLSTCFYVSQHTGGREDGKVGNLDVSLCKQVVGLFVLVCVTNCIKLDNQISSLHYCLSYYLWTEGKSTQYSSC